MTMEADIPSDELNLWTYMSTVGNPDDEAGGWDLPHMDLFQSFVIKVTAGFHKGNHIDRDTLVTNVWNKVRRSWDTFLGKGDPRRLRAWLDKTSINAARDIWRVQNRLRKRERGLESRNRETGELYIPPEVELAAALDAYPDVDSRLDSELRSAEIIRVILAERLAKPKEPLNNS